MSSTEKKTGLKDLGYTEGFAWDPFRDGRTSVRAGYAIAVDQPMTSLVTVTAANPPLAIPLNFAAEEAGFNVIGWYRDVLPNYQLTAMTVRRSWAEANRPLLIRFVKGMALAMRWVFDIMEPAIDFLTNEMKLKPAHALRGWEYYTAN